MVLLGLHKMFLKNIKLLFLQICKTSAESFHLKKLPVASNIAISSLFLVFLEYHKLSGLVLHSPQIYFQVCQLRRQTDDSLMMKKSCSPGNNICIQDQHIPNFPKGIGKGTAGLNEAWMKS